MITWVFKFTLYFLFIYHNVLLQVPRYFGSYDFSKLYEETATVFSFKSWAFYPVRDFDNVGEIR